MMERVQKRQENDELNVEGKLQSILELYQHEQSAVARMKNEVENKRKKLNMLQDSIGKMERDIVNQEEVLYNSRLKLTRISEHVNGYIEQEQVEKTRQLEVYSAIKMNEEKIEKIETAMKSETLQYIDKLRGLNQSIFKAYQDAIADP